MILVSACLLGVNCKYNGENNDSEAVRTYLEGKSYLAICPEVSAGLAPPRPPSEIRDGRVYSKNGEDLTEPFIRGAEAVWEQSMIKAKERKEEIELAILKARSPSCGSGTIYDGTFTGARVPGDGFFASLLKQKGIKVISEEDINEKQ